MFADDEALVWDRRGNLFEDPLDLEEEELLYPAPLPKGDDRFWTLLWGLRRTGVFLEDPTDPEPGDWPREWR